MKLIMSKTRAKLFFLTVLALTILAVPATAFAHPLGNFTVNQYSRIEVGAAGVNVYFVLDMAEIPTFQEKDRIDHVPDVIQELAKRVDLQADATSASGKSTAAAHGKQRARQGYSIPLIVIEMRLLQRVISTVLQHNLIRMDLSTVIGDMVLVGESLQEQLEFSIRGFQQSSREAA